jgi:hypothetical protein
MLDVFAVRRCYPQWDTSGIWGVHKILLAHTRFVKFCPVTAVLYCGVQVNCYPWFYCGVQANCCPWFYCGVQVNCCPWFPLFLIDLDEIRYIHLYTVPLTGLEFREHRRGVGLTYTGRKWDSIDACNVKPCDILNVNNALVEPLYCVTEYYHKWDSVQSGAGWGWRNSWSSNI